MNTPNPETAEVVERLRSLGDWRINEETPSVILIGGRGGRRISISWRSSDGSEDALAEQTAADIVALLALAPSPPAGWRVVPEGLAARIGELVCDKLTSIFDLEDADEDLWRRVELAVCEAYDAAGEESASASPAQPVREEGDPSPESPAGWRAGWKVDVEYAQEMAREAYEEALRLGMECGADICISQDLVDDCWHRSTIAAELRSRLSAAPEPSREQDMGEGNQGLSSDVQSTGHRPRVPRRERG
jgi:hypothetical protein